MSIVPEGKIITKKQKLIATTTAVAGVAVVIVAKKKFNTAIEAAKAAGVDEWLGEMGRANLTMVVLTPELANQFFTQTAEITR